MLKEILKNALLGVAIACSFAAVSVGTYAIIDCISKTNTDAIQKEETNNIYTIKFDANGGVGTMENIVFTTGTNMTTILPKCTFTKEGWSFCGWSTTTNYKGIFATPGPDNGSYTLDDVFFQDKKNEITYYAIWGKLMIFDPQGADDTYGSRKWYIIEEDIEWFNEKANNPQFGSYSIKKSGYLFGGYFTEPNGGGIQYFDEHFMSTDNFIIENGRTLYAFWVQIPTSDDTSSDSTT